MNQERLAMKYFIVIFYFSFAILPLARSDNEERVSEWIEPTSCTKSKNEYFHTDLFECKKCHGDSVPSDDGYSCVCNKTSKFAFEEGNPICIGCEPGKFRTSDGVECILCKNSSCGCSGNEIIVERSRNGALLDIQECVACPENTYPSSDHSKCLPCSAVSSKDDGDHRSRVLSSRDIFLEYCMPPNSPKDWPDVQSTYTIEFKNKRTSVDSYYLRTELRFAYLSCQSGVRQACARLANMCSLTLFETSGLPCKLFIRKTDQDNRPKLFYREGDARGVLNRRTIKQRYTLDRENPMSNRLKLIVARFGLEGKFESISEPTLPCPFFGNLPFGVNLSKKCKIPAIELSNARMEFFVPYLSYSERSSGEKNFLYPLPIFIKNINDNVDQDDVSRWKLVRRFFSIDKITGYRAISNSKNSSFTKEPKLQVLRYIKSLSLLVKLQERTERGKIFPPLLIVEYDELTNQEMLGNVEVSIEYRVTYNLSDDEMKNTIEIFIGISTGLGVIFAAIKAWSYSQRNCKNITNIATIGSFVIYSLGAVGNILLIICSSSSIYTFIFYKGQKVVHLLLPNSAYEKTIRICTMVAFAFKAVEICALMYQQRRTNIFFIDWEQPRIISSVNPPSKISPRIALKKYSQSSGKLNFSNERKTALVTASEVIGARRKKNTSPSKSMSPASTSSNRESIDNEISMDRLSSSVQQPTTVFSERDFSIDEHNNDEDNNYSVSIWRTCVVANEWLKLKTTRKINILLQILATLFILEILGLKFWSKAIPELTTDLDEMLSAEDSFTLEYAVGIFVYLIVYTGQWWFTVFIYQRYVKNRLQEFVDLCSMANISVFMLSHDFYGYYIHGRSVHGFADTDLSTLIKYLSREENNLCAHRGLIPGTTEQTFVISVSKTFRTFYDRVLGSQNSGNGKFLRPNLSNGPANWDERWKTYLRLRKFLTGFLDHCYKNVDYTVKERHCLEKMCDLEMADVEEKSIFYIDNAYSFDRTIFYGNEWSLATFEINAFLLVLVLGGNYISASFVALIAAKTTRAIGKFNGKRALAGKTFVDERFLVSQ